jgi:hypothetical protein
VGFRDGVRDGATFGRDDGKFAGPKVVGFNVVVVGSEVGDMAGCLLGVADGAAVGERVGFADGFLDGTSVGKGIGKFFGFADGTADGIFMGARVGLGFFFKETSERLGTGDTSVISTPVVSEIIDAIINAHKNMRNEIDLVGGSDDAMIGEEVGTLSGSCQFLTHSARCLKGNNNNCVQKLNYWVRIAEKSLLLK